MAWHVTSDGAQAAMQVSCGVRVWVVVAVLVVVIVVWAAATAESARVSRKCMAK
jgi:hypothetical protein